MKNKIDIQGVIERLKRELGYRYDTELSERLGKDPKYISVIKGRETFGGEVWIQILNIAKNEGISLNWLLYGKQGRAMSAQDVMNSTISENVSGDEKRNELVRRLSEAIVTHRSLNKGESSEDLLDLANVLILKLMSKDQ